jgi:hypothetical protein
VDSKKKKSNKKRKSSNSSLSLNTIQYKSKGHNDDATKNGSWCKIKNPCLINMDFSFKKSVRDVNEIRNLWFQG